MAGTIPLSMTQQFDVYGEPLAGGQLYIIAVGTVSTPQDAFQDTGLTPALKMPYPMTLDAAGRVPQFFLADGSVKIRLQDKFGVVQLAADSVLVIGPSAGGGGGSTVDATQLIQTGNLIARYGVGALSGYVRCNNLTIGSATSGATERANLDCQNLFQYLWGVDATLAVSGGRGASAAADWTANKQLSLPDWRGYALAALDDMGNSASGRLSAAYWGGNPILLGSVGGNEWTTLTALQIPSITSGVTVSSVSVSGTISGSTGPVVSGTGSGSGAAVGVGWPQVASVGVSGSCSATGTGSGSATSNNTSGNAHRTIGPRKLCTVYMKL